MNRRLIYIGVAVVLLLFVGAIVTLNTNLGKAVVASSKTYAASQTDTVKYYREAGLSGLSFGINVKDSSNFLNAVLKRVVDGVPSPTLSTDTLFSLDSSSSNTGRSIIKTVTLAPLAEEYWVIVKYTASNGAIDQGTTTATVKYQFNKQFSRRNSE